MPEKVDVLVWNDTSGSKIWGNEAVETDVQALSLTTKLERETNAISCSSLR